MKPPPFPRPRRALSPLANPPLPTSSRVRLFSTSTARSLSLTRGPPLPLANLPRSSVPAGASLCAPAFAALSLTRGSRQLLANPPSLLSSREYLCETSSLAAFSLTQNPPLPLAKSLALQPLRIPLCDFIACLVVRAPRRPLLLSNSPPPSALAGPSPGTPMPAFSRFLLNSQFAALPWHIFALRLVTCRRFLCRHYGAHCRSLSGLFLVELIIVRVFPHPSPAAKGSVSRPFCRANFLVERISTIMCNSLNLDLDCPVLSPYNCGR